MPPWVLASSSRLGAKMRRSRCFLRSSSRASQSAVSASHRPRVATRLLASLLSALCPRHPGRAATTWLFECMHVAFVPEMVCPAPTRRDLPAGQDHLRAAAVNFPHTLIFHPLDWSRQGCQNRRFMLPGISCSVSGGCSHRKELFFYGSGFGDFFKVGMAALHGPELPLELFRKQSRKLSAMTGRSFDHYRVKRFKEFCFNSKFTHLPTYRMHPACCLARASQAKRWSCRWHETLRIRYGKYHSTWMQTAMPWVRPSEYQFASVDFTPNYLCSAAALQNINATARDPSELRFIVSMLKTRPDLVEPLGTGRAHFSPTPSLVH